VAHHHDNHTLYIPQRQKHNRSRERSYIVRHNRNQPIVTDRLMTVTYGCVYMATVHSYPVQSAGRRRAGGARSITVNRQPTTQNRIQPSVKRYHNWDPAGTGTRPIDFCYSLERYVMQCAVVASLPRAMTQRDTIAPKSDDI
jgi:hypothetical protein